MNMEKDSRKMPGPLGEMDEKSLRQEASQLVANYRDFKRRGLSLNMARGKPSSQQLDLSMGMLDMLDGKSVLEFASGLDVRNYGGLEGLPEARELLASLVDARGDQAICFGNASLTVMYDMISRAMTHGICGHTPWGQLPVVKFLCPVPGYDRHFAMTEHFGIRMINVPMYEDGPDMFMVENLVKNDASIKGIWCVPKFTNPQGYVYSAETVERFSKLKPKAKDFRIFWDNAYCVHYLYNEIEIPNILALCEKEGNPDMVYEFVSTSKISFAGAGISAMLSSHRNLEDIKKSMAVQTISHDKVNQLRHTMFFKSKEGVLAHMRKHAVILAPKFEMVLSILERDLSGRDAGTWSRPRGGYFITFEAKEGCAARIIKLAKNAGVLLTDAGAPFPYHRDPHDSVIRIAPSFPTLEALEQATDIFTICAKIATIEKILQEELV